MFSAYEIRPSLHLIDLMNLSLDKLILPPVEYVLILLQTLNMLLSERACRY